MASDFAYDFHPRVAPILRLLGVRPDRDGVTVTEDGLFRATFGRFKVETPVTNIASAENNGPYRLLKAVGLRMSLVDSGLTFGTTGRSGACVVFHEPVDQVVPFRRHRGLTVTVADPDGLVAAIKDAQRA